MTQKARTGLVWRLYAIGVVQFSLVVLATLAISFVMSDLPGRWDMQSLSARLEPLANDPAGLARELQELRARDKLLVSIYDERERLLVSNVVPALLPPRWGGRWPPQPQSSEDQHENPFDDEGRPPPSKPPFSEPPARFNGPPDGQSPLPDTFTHIELNGSECLLVVRFKHPHLSAIPPLLTMLSGVLVLGVGAFLTARWIARPLTRLSQMATSLGQGDLRARSELSRNDEVGEVARAFDEMAERIQRLLQNEKELLANVAHELRTPLARIRVALEIAGEGDAPTVRSSLSEIAVDLSELESLINDVLTAARFELVDGVAKSSQFALHLQEIAPRTIGERSADRFRASHPERPFSAHFEPGSGVIDADPVLLRRVIDNLLENAHKYSPDPEAAILLEVSEQGERACFEIKDGGMGISSEDLPRVFTAFFRGERSRSRGTGGVGLGLTLAERIVEAHGGSIEVESGVGTGSTFRALLPMHAPISSPPSRS
jgi:two-component system OmpR family sensor kinase